MIKMASSVVVVNVIKMAGLVVVVNVIKMASFVVVVAPHILRCNDC